MMSPLRPQWLVGRFFVVGITAFPKACWYHWLIPLTKATDDADGIPVTGPSIFHQKDIIGWYTFPPLVYLAGKHLEAITISRQEKCTG